MIRYICLLMTIALFSCESKTNLKAVDKEKIIKTVNDSCEFIDFDSVSDNWKMNYYESNKNNLSDSIVTMYKIFDKLNVDEIENLMFLIEKSKKRYNDLYLHIIFKINKKNNNSFSILERSGIFYFDLLATKPRIFYKYFNSRKSDYKVVIKSHIDNIFQNFPDSTYKDSLYRKHIQNFKNSDVNYIFKGK